MFGVPNPIAYGALGVVAVLMLALLGQTVRLSYAQLATATARQHQAEAENVAVKVNEIFARNEADQERRRAEQAKANADELLRLRDERDAIETRYKNVSADRAKLSAANKRFIANAPKSDSRDLGPTMFGYFVCLRQQQAERTGGAAPTSRNCREAGLP